MLTVKQVKPTRPVLVDSGISDWTSTFTTCGLGATWRRAGRFQTQLLLTSLPGVIMAGQVGLVEGHRGLMHWYVGEEPPQLGTTSHQLTKFPGDPDYSLQINSLSFTSDSCASISRCFQTDERWLFQGATVSLGGSLTTWSMVSQAAAASPPSWLCCSRDLCFPPAHQEKTYLSHSKSRYLCHFKDFSQFNERGTQGPRAAGGSTTLQGIEPLDRLRGIKPPLWDRPSSGYATADRRSRQKPPR